MSKKYASVQSKPATMKQSLIHDQAYEYYTWEELGRCIFEVAKKIIESGEQFDRVVALAKGGLTFSRSLVDYLDINDVSSMQISFYNSVYETNKTPVITQSLPVSVKGERILLFDDLVDKGETMKIATEYLKMHGVTEIKTATLLHKPWSTFKVDYSARETQAWIIFPNEAREHIQLFQDIWGKMGDSPEQIHQQLLKIGFSEEEVALFTNLK
jgi:hypoxanthine phosphoribosyltransferase